MTVAASVAVTITSLRLHLTPLQMFLLAMLIRVLTEVFLCY